MKKANPMGTFTVRLNREEDEGKDASITFGYLSALQLPDLQEKLGKEVDDNSNDMRRQVLGMASVIKEYMTDSTNVFDEKKNITPTVIGNALTFAELQHVVTELMTTNTVGDDEEKKSVLRSLSAAGVFAKNAGQQVAASTLPQNPAPLSES